MLLVTWSGFWVKCGHFFQWTFRLMEGPNRNINILFIVIGAIGAIYWLWRQTNYNKQAEQTGAIK